MVLPPATSAGCVAITIRRPCDEVWSIENFKRERDLSRHAPRE